ncbi:MAG: S1 family peptidase [Minisyncoccia bacterium]
MRSSLFALFAVAAVALFIGLFSGGVSVVTKEPPTMASTTLATVTPIALPPLTLPAIGATSTAPKKMSPPVAVVSTSTGAAPSAPSVPAPASPAPVLPAAPPSGDLSADSDLLRAALVNILCASPAGSSLQSISGSGVIVSSTGMILTNSHIGQYFLLADRGVSCVIRTGSPAQAAYEAAPVFVSPAWIAANPSVLEEQSPTGTGEHDFALLAIDASATESPLPASFPFVPLATAPPTLGEPVVIGSYAAQFLKTSEIENALSPTIVYGAIQSVYTFAVDSVDVVSLGGNAAAQEGSSGGGAIDASGYLTATITTSTTAGDTAARDLDAITASYIRRDYATEIGVPLDSLLAEDPFAAIQQFAPEVPALESELNLPQ